MSQVDFWSVVWGVCIGAFDAHKVMKGQRLMWGTMWFLGHINSKRSGWKS